MNSHLTPDELLSLGIAGLPDETPYIVRNVSHGMLSVARHYGGCKAFGTSYVYLPPTDELIRWDVLKWLGKHRKAQRKAAKAEAKARQTQLVGL